MGGEEGFEVFVEIENRIHPSIVPGLARTQDMGFTLEGYEAIAIDLQSFLSQSIHRLKNLVLRLKEFFCVGNPTRCLSFLP